MARLIDADALGIGRCNPDAFPLQNRGYCAGWNGVISLIEQAPTVDAVHVVRCKNCKMWEPGDSMMGDSIDDMQRVGGCQISRFRRLENDFCSYGERRTDGK